MIIGTVESCFIFWRQCCTSALLSISTTAPKRFLFKNANFWWFQALFNLFVLFRKQYCASAQLRGTIVPKKLFNNANVWCFSALLSFFVFRRQCCTSAFLMASTTARKQRLFISANSWSLLALLKMVFFCGGSVVLRHCWELVHQCRKECYSTLPTFDNFSALLIILLFSGGNVVLGRCWWLVHQCRKNVIQQCHFWWILGTAYFFLLSGVMVVLGASGGWYYSAETVVVH